MSAQTRVPGANFRRDLCVYMGICCAWSDGCPEIFFAWSCHPCPVKNIVCNKVRFSNLSLGEFQAQILKLGLVWESK